MMLRTASQSQHGLRLTRATALSTATEFVDVDIAPQRLRIEHQWLGRDRAHAPLLVFLHEGLGSVSMWRDFPARLCDAARCRGLVYSRPGYGQSSPDPAGSDWGPRFMHHQAHAVLPALLAALGVDTRAQPPLLLGHSDGGSIALLHAAAHPQQVAGLVVMAPHIVVEPLSVTSIQTTRRAYAEGDLRARLARHHHDVDAAFWGWNRVWLSPAFRDWDITENIAAITCPLLAIQGEDDEYGTLEQVYGIARRVPQTQLLVLPDCGHSPQRDRPDAVVTAVTDFMARGGA
jgi:pimeloyl-ACP methyl ester carboxylesterase